jgi:hypothetical protein
MAVGDSVTLSFSNRRKVKVLPGARPDDAVVQLGACRALALVETSVTVHRNGATTTLRLKAGLTVAELRAVVGASEKSLTLFRPATCGALELLQRDPAPETIVPNDSSVWFTASPPKGGRIRPDEVVEQTF